MKSGEIRKREMKGNREMGYLMWTYRFTNELLLP